MPDLLIRGASVMDGLGSDAGGPTLCPGIVELHTHHGAQITRNATLFNRSSGLPAREGPVHSS